MSKGKDISGKNKDYYHYKIRSQPQEIYLSQSNSRVMKSTLYKVHYTTISEDMTGHEILLVLMRMTLFDLMMTDDSKMTDLYCNILL